MYNKDLSILSTAKLYFMSRLMGSAAQMAQNCLYVWHRDRELCRRQWNSFLHLIQFQALCYLLLHSVLAQREESLFLGNKRLVVITLPTARTAFITVSNSSWHHGGKILFWLQNSVRPLPTLLNTERPLPVQPTISTTVRTEERCIVPDATGG